MLAMLSAIIPLARGARRFLPLWGIGRPSKLPAQQTTVAFARYVGVKPDSARDLQCVDHTETSDAKGRTGAWDYVCTFVADPSSGPRRVKYGVRVDDKRITRVSQRYELEARYIRP